MIEYSQQGDVAVLNWDDGKVNSLSHATLDLLNQHLDRALTDARAVVIAGRPGLLSAGFNLKEVAPETEALGPGSLEMPPLVHKGATFLLRLFSHPQPVVAACTGHAIAAGAMMLLASDTRIGTQGEFKISLNETAIDMIMPAFGIELVKSRMSPVYQSLCVIQAHMFDPQTAMTAGFFVQLVEADQVLTTAIEQAAALAALPGNTYAYNKMMLRQSHADIIQASLN